ncbi:MAG: hypothetical protein AMXMBFR13_22560 [Phycisphaerae bacterium]
MESPEFEIEIRPNGEVKALVKGISGQRCLSYADLLAEIVGKEKARELTAEYYQQETAVRIQAHQRRT